MKYDGLFKAWIIVCGILVVIALTLCGFTIWQYIHDQIEYHKYVDYLQDHDEDAPLTIIDDDTLLDMHLFLTEDKDGDREIHILKEENGEIKEFTIN